jgi:hypothetical protein
MATRKIADAHSDDRRRISITNGDSPGPLIAVMIVTNGFSGLNIIESRPGKSFALTPQPQAARQIPALLSVERQTADSARTPRRKAFVGRPNNSRIVLNLKEKSVAYRRQDWSRIGDRTGIYSVSSVASAASGGRNPSE